MLEKKKSFFGKEESIMLSGIAILLMIWHHFFGFNEWLSEGVSYNRNFGSIGYLLVNIPANSGKICVQIFAIITGYAIYINKEAYSNSNKRISRIFKFLISYWLIYAIFLFIGWINKDTLPTLNQFIKNLFGLDTSAFNPWINVSHAWYVSFYIELILLVPLLIKFFKKGDLYHDILGSFFLLLISVFLPLIPLDGALRGFLVNIHPIFCVGIGILSAKYEILERIHIKLIKRVPFIGLMIGFYLLLYLYYKLPQFFKMFDLVSNILGIFTEAVLGFFTVLVSLEIINRIKFKVIKNLLLLLGSLSLYLWFIHGIFHTGNHFLQAQIYSLKEPLLIFIVVLIITIPVAYSSATIHSLIWKKISKFL